MNDEGKLKKRISEEIARTDMDVENVMRILDEARKEIFSGIHVEMGVDTRRTDVDVKKLVPALFKWFGEFCVDGKCAEGQR